MSKIEYPEGAIRTLAQVKGLVARAGDGEKIIIYEIIMLDMAGKYPPDMYQNELGKACCISEDITMRNRLFLYKSRGISPKAMVAPNQSIGLDSFNLDKESHQKGNFLFENYFLAKAYYQRLLKRCEDAQK